MALQLLTISSGESKAEIESFINLEQGSDAALQSYANYFPSILGGIQRATIYAKVGAIQAAATLTSTGAAVAAETFTLANVVFTARASGATGNEFNVSGTVGTQAANIAAAINASSDLTGIVTATSALGVTTITAVVPGVMTNGLQISEGLTNVALAAFSGGSDGDTLTIDES